MRVRAAGLAGALTPWLVPVGLASAGLLLLAGRGRSLVGASAGVVLLCALGGWARVALPDPFPPVRGVRPGPAVLEGLVAGRPEIEGPRARFPLALGLTAAALIGSERVCAQEARPEVTTIRHSTMGRRCA